MISRQNQFENHLTWYPSHSPTISWNYRPNLLKLAMYPLVQRSSSRKQDNVLYIYLKMGLSSKIRFNMHMCFSSCFSCNFHVIGIRVTSMHQMAPLCPLNVPSLSPLFEYQTVGLLSLATENNRSPSRLYLGREGEEKGRDGGRGSKRPHYE